MPDDPLLAVQDLLPVHARSRLAQPEAGIGKHHRHGRQRAQILFVDEAQLLLIQGIAAEAESQRIKHRVARRVFVRELLERPVQQFFDVERHLEQSSKVAERDE